jgi:hypothetical protein
MNEGARNLVSALLAIVYAAVILAVGELYIINRTTKLPTILVPPSSGTPATPTARWLPQAPHSRTTPLVVISRERPSLIAGASGDK